MTQRSVPATHGLFDPMRERDACGVGFVAHTKNRKSHDIIRQGLQLLICLTHRGAVGADPLASDGCGVLLQTPDRFLRAETEQYDLSLPPEGHYACGMVFLPRDSTLRALCESTLTRLIETEGQFMLGWRDVPVKSTCLGESVRSLEPVIRQVFVGRGPGCVDRDSFDRKLFIIRKQAFNQVRMAVGDAARPFHLPSLSSRTLVYKGMIMASRMADYFPDLSDQRLESALALVHQRFSTNTLPSWDLAQPFRYLCHNGEINTLRGNINWMAARRDSMRSATLGKDLTKLWPLLAESKSDSATFDHALELLVNGGYTLAHAMMMMIPEAWADNPLMSDDRRAFYEFHAALMEPWDGPAAVAFTDGRQIGATLDRNGLRPARYIITDDDRVVLSSEVGVFDIPDSRIVKKWRLQPGKMFLIDLEQGRIIDDSELKTQLAAARPYQQWLDATQIRLETLPAEAPTMAPDPLTLLSRQQAFGYSQENIKFLLIPMAVNGQDPVGSMGRDIPPAVLSNRPKRLFDYFYQTFAQVTNPPIDPIREELVMSLVSLIGPRPNLLGLEEAGQHRRLEVKAPVLSNTDLEKIRRIENHVDSAFRTYTLNFCWPASAGVAGLEPALLSLCQQAEQHVKNGGYNILILSDRLTDADHVPIPSLLATAAVHHHLIRHGLRTEVGLVVETGEAYRLHDFCCLAGYGAEAINPYLALDTLQAMRKELGSEAESSYIKAVNKGILKVMSKMGISTYQSYCGAQIFDAVGLSCHFVERYFTGTHSVIDGIGLREIADETITHHRMAFGADPSSSKMLLTGGELAYREQGEHHVWISHTVSILQMAVRTSNRDLFREFSSLIDDQEKTLYSLRGLFTFKYTQPPVPLEEVEPLESIAKRFATGAISFGAISWEAHTTLAIAMNRLGGKSNTGEGGEEASRYKPLPNGDSLRSAVKQVASGRFGVTTEYLVNADDIQIKMAQGAKPGEGGQLPGHKVDEWIARVRHSTPGVGLISPPPHHDIYSIEDLAQLIHDLKNVNPMARISVKLVSEVGVGTIAAGVAKARADHILISGHDGGTGASPLTSIYSAGSPWEIGLAETHQTLVATRLRGRVTVQVDGGLRTARDVVIGALLGADEFGIATATLISAGCLMMRKCHLNTCPVGIATQNPVLRRRFAGQPEHVVNYFTFLVEEMRKLMAALGFRTVNEMIGRTDILETRLAVQHWKAKGLDLSRLLAPALPAAGVATYHCEAQDHGLEQALDHSLLRKAKVALYSSVPITLSMPIRNTYRTVGAMLSGAVARRHGHDGLPNDTLCIKFTGTAGQSFGAFLAHGVTLELTGDANDYVGKGLSGGRIIITPPAGTSRRAEDNIIVGNTVLYGAIAGECYFRGVAGERFAVRNSGAIAVVEGCGDHGCEYMTGGVVVVLGGTGRNFAAGMSGGIAYVLDDDGSFHRRCNLSMVDLETIKEEEADMAEPRSQQHDLKVQDSVALLLGDMSRFDTLRLKTLLEKHNHFTGSTRAQAILEHWHAFLPRFIKVMPVEYRHALLERRAKSANGMQAGPWKDRGAA
ncbi:Glutamate synthase [NADPH] large chain [invertebrate metagenome]|uniref:Glutamate synthase [NADPH] large chain n=1 Tax=invertebrate metagenome TaxID=1711999 RepID=A0A484H7V1_9ZZZZ